MPQNFVLTFLTI